MKLSFAYDCYFNYLSSELNRSLSEFSTIKIYSKSKEDDFRTGSTQVGCDRGHCLVGSEK